MQIIYILESFLSDFAKRTTNVLIFSYRYLYNSITCLFSFVFRAKLANICTKRFVVRIKCVTLHSEAEEKQVQRDS